MRVLHISSGSFTAGERAYPSFFLAQGLRQLGHEVLIVAEPGDLVQRLDDKGIEFVALEKGRGKRPRRQQIHRILRDWQPHVVHVASVELAFPCLASKIPSLLSWSEEAIALLTDHPFHLFYPRLIVPSEYHREQSLKQGRLTPDQVAVVPESLDFDAYARWVTLQASQPQSPPPSEGIRLLYQPCATQPEEWTRVLEASYLHAREGRAHQLLVMHTPNHFLSDLDAQQRLINHELGYPLIERLDASWSLPSVLPSVDAVLGNGKTIMQALACGKPAIWLSDGALGGWITSRNVYVIEENRFESLQVRSLEALTQDLSALLRRSPSILRATCEARELARQIVAPSSIAQRTLAVYQACLRTWKPVGRLRRWYRQWRFR